MKIEADVEDLLEVRGALAFTLGYLEGDPDPVPPTLAVRLEAAWKTLTRLIGDQQWPRPLDGHPSITCPKCGVTSYNPNDIQHGFCGNCNAWTSPTRVIEH